MPVSVRIIEIAAALGVLAASPLGAADARGPVGTLWPDQDLAAALDEFAGIERECRLIEPYLPGFRHAPWRPDGDCFGDSGDPKAVATEAMRVGQIAALARRVPDPWRSIASQVPYLGRATAPSLKLITGAADFVESPCLLAFVAAAYLSQPGSPGESAARALEAASKAIQLGCDSPASFFNQALAFERLGLRVQAERAMEAAQRRSRDPGWSAEISSRRTRLAWTPLNQAGLHSRLLAAVSRGDDELFGVLQAAGPEIGRTEGQRLLVLWGEQVLEGGGRAASVHLDQARFISIAVQRASGDALLRETVARIDEEIARGGEIQPIARSFAAFGRGLAAEKVQAFARAGAAYDEALEGLQQLPSSLVAALLLQRAAMSVYLEDPARARAESRAARAHLDRSRHPAAWARSLWIEGILLMNGGAAARAADKFDAAADAYETGSERGHASFLHSLVGNSLLALGLPSRAWEARTKALVGLDAVADCTRVYTVLTDAADQASAEGWMFTSDALSRELLARVADCSDAVVAEAHLRYAKVQAQAGAHASALDLLHIAAERARRIEDAVLSRRVLSDLRAAEGEVLLEADPAVALAGLTAAIAAYEGAEFASNVCAQGPSLGLVA